MTMDIDNPGSDELSVFMHPLSLIHMSDQYTRVRMGGSPLDPKAPVVGLLFGKTVATTTKHPAASAASTANNPPASTLSIYVEDAGDIPLDGAQSQIDLHRAVFPKQHLLGWYKVAGHSSSNEPTAHDLKQTVQIRTLQQQQPPPEGDDSNKGGGNSSSSASPNHTFLGLLQVPKSKTKASSHHSDSKPKAADQAGGDMAMKDHDNEEEDEELPLTIYQLNEAGTALVAVSTWTLQTSESERIAVQRVIREKAEAPTAAPAAAPQGGSSGEQGGTAAASNTNLMMLMDQGPIESKTIVPYADEVQESCQAIATRLSVLLQYLESLSSSSSSSGSSSVPPEHLPLLRQVQGLLLQLGAIRATAAADSDNNNQSAAALQQLAGLAKTVDSVTLYAEKFRFVHEHASTGGSSGSGGRGPASREMRRGF